MKPFRVTIALPVCELFPALEPAPVAALAGRPAFRPADVSFFLIMVAEREIAPQPRDLFAQGVRDAR
jgi:hypothetical protein